MNNIDTTMAQIGLDRHVFGDIEGIQQTQIFILVLYVLD